MNEQNIEAMSEILEEFGVCVTESVLEKIVESYDLHIETAQDIENMSRGGYTKPVCEKCKLLKQEINDLESQVETYRSSVKTRRNCEHVWTEDGKVMYE